MLSHSDFIRILLEFLIYQRQDVSKRLLICRVLLTLFLYFDKRTSHEIKTAPKLLTYFNKATHYL